MSKAPGIFVSYEDKKQRITLIISVSLYSEDTRELELEEREKRAISLSFYE